MNDELQWTEERCQQLADLELVIREVANANSANNFLHRMNKASKLAEQLLNGSYPAFVLFLNRLAIENRQNQAKNVRRKAYICKSCEGVYPDQPVSSCDCMDNTANEYYEGFISYATENP